MPDIVSAPPVIACGAVPNDLIPISDSYLNDDDEGFSIGGRPGRKKRRSPRFLTGGSSSFAFAAFFSQLMFRTGRGKKKLAVSLLIYLSFVSLLSVAYSNL